MMETKDYYAFDVKRIPDDVAAVTGFPGFHIMGHRAGEQRITETLASTQSEEIARDIVRALTPRKVDVYRELAKLVVARQTCDSMTPRNGEWFIKHGEAIKKLVREHFPSGSGFDSGTHLDFDKSTGEKLVFITAFHHMNDGGMYDGWTEHVITVKPSLAFGFTLKISGTNRNDIKDMIAEAFS